MTGLSLSTDYIIEVACYVTDSQLNLLDETGFEAVIHRSKKTMDRMDAWCTRTHGESGLTRKVLASTTTQEQVAEQLLAYIKKYVSQPRKGLLAGNTVHMDKAFLAKEMPQVVDYLHYRILDVSSIKEAARRWCSVETLMRVPRKEGKHEARADILESIEEAKFWKRVLFDE